uniref:Uncharacterized protein n=1 Tax=Daphnia galeata TaxID=27404 RepID=A0A8J2VYH5_9CRUS|nr:unnamed protein product [Daphnia galeata]
MSWNAKFMKFCVCVLPMIDAVRNTSRSNVGSCLAMTATIGVSFGAGSAAKRILLFAINVTVLLLGLTCSVLCLYQVKLMPETYEMIVAAIQESNLTTPEPVSLPPGVTVSKNGNYNDRNMIRTTKKGRPRVGPQNGSSRYSQIPPIPVTLGKNPDDAVEMGTVVTSSLGTQILDITKPVIMSQTTTATSTISSMMSKASTSSSILSTRLETPTPLKNGSSDDILDFGQVLKDRIAQLENELRLAQLQQQAKLHFPIKQIQTSTWAMAETTTLTSRPAVLITESIPTTPSQLSTQPANTIVTSITASKSTEGLASSLLSTPSTVLLSSSRPTVDGLSSASAQTSVAVTSSTTTLTEKATIVSSSSTTERPTTSTTSTVMFTTKPITTETSRFHTNTLETSVASSTTLISSTTKDLLLMTSTPTTLLVTVSTTSPDPTTITAFTSSMIPVIPQSDSTQTTAQATTLTEMSSSPSIEASTSLMTSTKDMPLTILAHTTASFTSTPTATSSMSPSVTTQKAITTLMATTTSRPVSTTISSTKISLASSTKKLNTSSTTPSSVGFINLTNVIDSINKLVGRRDLSARILRKRSSATTSAPVVSTSDTLTADHIPIYFEQVFFLVQTSLYVCTAAGLLIFFSSLVGICGGLFRIDGCLKFSVAALVLVIMAEMATTAFIFVAHDKASNRNKNKNFDRDLKLLCDLANFCVQPMLLVITGSFLCVSVVLQIGSITLACNLMDNRTESDPDKKFRQMMRSSRPDLQFGSGNMYNNPYTNPMPMPMPCCGGRGGYGGMNHLPYPSPMMMPMQNMYPPVFTGPGQRPIVNIIS